MPKPGKEPEIEKIHWKDLDDEILATIQNLKLSGYTHPTIRSIYYVLGTQGVIPLTNSGYKSLDAKIVKMRKEGAIPWGYFAVKRGTSRESGVPVALPGDLSATIPYVLPADWGAHWIRQVRDAGKNFQLPRWYGQPNLVEVWVEKDGLLGATANWLGDLGVTVRAPQGYGAWEFIHDSLRRIRAELEIQKKEEITILYLGDMDPSGKDIPRFMELDALAHFEEETGVHVTFKEIGLSAQQVHHFHLPQQPDSADVLAKIARDPRLKWYRKHYPPNLFVELDAFYALATKGAKALIRSAVDALFDEEVYEDSRETESTMRKGIAKAIKALVKFQKPKKKKKPKKRKSKAKKPKISAPDTPTDPK